jgi:hypothetical protein
MRGGGKIKSRGRTKKIIQEQKQSKIEKEE